MTAVSTGERPDPKALIGSAEIRRLIEGMVRRKVPAREVDDLVQTVLVDALAASDIPSERETLRRWIAGITRHKVADFHRKASRGRSEALPDQVEGKDDDHEARDLAAWADEQVEGNPEQQRTLSWMAREGAGEKLAHIAADEDVAPTQVRQRVSRLRRLMKKRWMAEIAAVAGVAVALAVLWAVLGQDEKPEARPIGPEPPTSAQPDPRLDKARRLRADALKRCEREDWRGCLHGLDEAARLDPAGDRAPAIGAARRRAIGALDKIPNPPPSASATPSAAPSASTTAPPPTKTSQPVTPPLAPKPAPPAPPAPPKSPPRPSKKMRMKPKAAPAPKPSFKSDFDMKQKK